MISYPRNAALCRADTRKISNTVLPTLFTELGSEIRHYSTIRTSLTTFLMTVALAAFTTFFHSDQHHIFVAIAGYVFAVAGGLACLYFSYCTEKQVIRYRKLRDKLHSGVRTSDQSGFQELDMEPAKSEVRRRMKKDWMNRLMLVGDLILMASFGLNGLIECILHWKT